MFVPTPRHMNRISQLQSLLATEPFDAFLLHALALEHIKIGDEEAARQLFETLLQKHPAHHGSYYHLAKLLERIQRPDDAIETYRTGMMYARQAGDKHAYAELEMALEDLEDA